MSYRKLTSAECATLCANGSYSASWGDIIVDDSFSTEQIQRSRLAGRVTLARGARIWDSYVANYSIGEDTLIDSVIKLECRHLSRFGNGTPVATINECGGRSVSIVEILTAQQAYLWATRRDRGDFVARLDSMAEAYALSKSSDVGQIGARCNIIGARFVREVNIGDDVTIDGASSLEDGTLLAGSQVGVDVKMKHFIAAENSTIASGATLERCMVGESAIIANGFTAIDSLFFANSHCENGEAASIFAGPYTVSHHKSSLLIAGLFSFFNAGSGSNQSNHLFKCGAVHQSIHPRGCKFASGAYIMAPAIEGAYTMVKGYHAKHHDTSDFPFSYLIDDDRSRSLLMPGANLTSYGTMRDTQKWEQRDRRTLCRDNITLKGDNPYLVGLMLRAVNTIHAMQEADPKAEEYIHGRVVIKPAHLRRGLGLYNKSIVASLGSMLSAVDGDAGCSGAGQWIDAAGQYLTSSCVETLIAGVERGAITSFEAMALELRDFHSKYDNYAYSWAVGLLSQLLGHEASAEDIEDAIASAEKSREGITRQALSDRDKDMSLDFSVGYGFDSDDSALRELDFKAVRGL